MADGRRLSKKKVVENPVFSFGWHQVCLLSLVVVVEVLLKESFDLQAEGLVKLTTVRVSCLVPRTVPPSRSATCGGVTKTSNKPEMTVSFWHGVKFVNLFWHSVSFVQCT